MDASLNNAPRVSCPAPLIGRSERVLLAHGEGGLLMRRLIHDEILPLLDNEFLSEAGDAATLPACSGRLAFTTDSFVVSPLFFPGGDIGSLAVYGTANDLAMAGARPRWMSLALILEEGLELTVLRDVLASVARRGPASRRRCRHGRHESRTAGRSRSIVHHDFGYRRNSGGATAGAAVNSS